MSTFADQLRSNLTARQPQTRGASQRPDEPHDAAAQRLAAADAAAEALLAEIFRPLVHDFRGVLESLGVLDDGLIAAERSPTVAVGQAGGQRSPTAAVGPVGGTKGKRRPDRQMAADYRAFLADRAQRGLPPPGPGNPTEEMAEFTRFMADERQRAEAAEANTNIPAWRRLAYRAGGVENGRRYEVRIAVTLAASPTVTGTIELSCECLHGSLSDFRRDSAALLIELPRKRVASGAYQSTDACAARQWCQGVLSQSAAAIMEAEMGIDPAPAGTATQAPIAAGLVPIAVPVTA